MSALLRLTIPAFPAVSLLGDVAIVGGCIALTLEAIRQRMLPRRDHLAQRYRLPSDPTALPSTYSESRKRDRLQYDMNRHREYQALDAALVEIDKAIHGGADIMLTAVLLPYGMSALERWSGVPIVMRQFVWAECNACGQRYSAEECSSSDWSKVADPRAGFGGKILACPIGHTVYVKETWIA